MAELFQGTRDSGFHAHKVSSYLMALISNRSAAKRTAIGIRIPSQRMTMDALVGKLYSPSFLRRKGWRIVQPSHHKTHPPRIRTDFQRSERFPAASNQPFYPVVSVAPMFADKVDLFPSGLIFFGCRIPCAQIPISDIVFRISYAIPMFRQIVPAQQQKQDSFLPTSGGILAPFEFQCLDTVALPQKDKI